MPRTRDSVSFTGVFLLTFGVFGTVVAQDKTQGRNDSTGRQPPVSLQKATAPTALDAAVTALGEDLVRAYQTHDAKAFAAVFTQEGEYVDDTDSLFHGREAIENEFKTFFDANPETTIKLRFDSIRSIAPSLVMAQGATSFQRSLAERVIAGRCSLIVAKVEDRWQVASLREVEVKDALTHHDHVSQLDWLVGEWINEGQRAEIHFSCRWDKTNKFLLRDFSVQAGNSRGISGTQRIGYDPISGHLKVWTFDSDGGYSDGYLRKDGEAWLLHTSGVTADGQLASGTEVFNPANAHRVIWDCVDRMVAGKRIADTGKITLVRKPPVPAAAEPVAPKRTTK